jgi:hypothetical protein
VDRRLLLPWDYFRVARNPSRVDAKDGDHLLQADCHENYLHLCRFLLERQCDRVAQAFQAVNQVSREVVLVELI